ncbi:MAG: 50S ribosomal protein L3 [Planctomycetes bacterium]|jgi:large subunit ribosomal protein L3|nr:50S ribosomal protein L3 [Planctomycetota bacterium]
MTLILGRKLGMTQIFADDGTVTGVTVVAAGPCTVCQVRTLEADGYDAIQLGFEDIPDSRSRKPQLGQFKKAGVAPKRVLREERLSAPATQKVGETITASIFKVGDIVDVVGTTKGRGFAGTIKRHGFHRGPETHGCMNVRQPGSIASRRIGKIPKGKRMGGHYGVERCTTKNLKVVRVDEARGLIFVGGPVPGPNQGLVQVQAARTPRRPAQVTPAPGKA